MQRAAPMLLRAAARPVARTIPRVHMSSSRVVARRNFSAEAAAPTKKGGSFFDNLPRNPDYEGYEAVVRYYLPTNDKFVLFVLAQYGAVIAYFVLKNKAKKRAEEAARPPPQRPDFRKDLEASSA